MNRIGLGFCSISVALAWMVACGSSTPAEFDDAAVTGHDANPDGVPYPTDHIGGTARSSDGKRPGDRIENFTFQGYDHGNVSAGLKVFSMADYFDPSAKRVKAIVLQGAGTWCAVCSEETNATTKVVGMLEAEGAIVLDIIVNGPSVNYGPSLTDVDQWISGHGSNYTTLIDVRARRLGTMGLTGVPWSALIDPRSMEILFATDGSPTDVVAFARLAEDFVAKNPPSY